MKMDIFTTIQYVGTPVALIAFIVATVAWSFKVKWKAKADLLEKLSPEDRETFLSKELETYQIDAAQKGVTGKDKVELMRLVILQRLARLKVLALTALVVAIVLAVVIILISLKGNGNVNAVGGSVGVSASGNAQVNVAMNPPNVSDAWLREEYKVCTGPSNHLEEMLNGNDDKRDIRNPHTVNNRVLKNLKLLGQEKKSENRLDKLETSIQLYGEDLDNLVGQNISGRNVGVREKGDEYKKYFSSVNPDINFLFDKGLLPDFLKMIKMENPSYNEHIVPIFSGCGEEEEEGGAGVIFYLRSLRTKSAIIENISDKTISDIVFSVREYLPDSRLKLESTADRKNRKWIKRQIPWSSEFLMPNEKIAFPLQVNLVPYVYTLYGIYESEIDSTKVDITEAPYIERSNDTDAYAKQSVPKTELLSFLKRSGRIDQSIDEPQNIDVFDVGAQYILDEIFFKVDGEKQERSYKRKLKFDAHNTKHVNYNCECGSCPLLYAKNENNHWRLLREIITSHKGIKNSKDFLYEIPISSKTIRINEYKGEMSYFSNLVIVIETLSGLYEHKLAVQPDNVSEVSYDSSLVIDLEDVKNGHDGIIKMYIRGTGYYETDSKNICPPVLPLDFKYFEEE